MKWTPSGGKRTAEAWVGDTQVFYLLTWVKGSPLSSRAFWLITRKVANASESVVIGRHQYLSTAKSIADLDLQELQEKGF